MDRHVRLDATRKWVIRLYHARIARKT